MAVFPYSQNNALLTWYAKKPHCGIWITTIGSINLSTLVQSIPGVTSS